MLQSEKLKITIKKIIEKVLLFRYHRISNKTAKNALKEIEIEKGKLSLKLKKKADKYACEILGWKGYAPWLYVYTHISGEFKNGWIPDNYYGKVVIQKIQGNYGKVSFLKAFNNKVFNEAMCPDLAYLINGKWFSNEFKPLSIFEVENLVKHNNDKVIFKSDFSAQGSGIFVYEKKDFDVNIVVENGEGVLQYFIEQHEFFNQFVKQAVATIRMTTVIDGQGKASLRACFIRFGRANDTHVVSKNQILVPVNMETGQLYENGYFSTYKSIKYHPDSKVTFLNKYIPNYKQCIDLAISLQEKMPMVTTIGWDLVVNKQGIPVIMEWNGFGSGIAFSEATQGPSFKDLSWDNFRI